MKGDTRRFWEREDLTPFARRVADWMLDQRPSVTVAELARRLRQADPEGKGVSSTAIWYWFYQQTIPQDKTLDLLATVIKVSPEELYELANRSWPVGEALQELITRIERDKRLPDDYRKALITRIQDVQANPDRDSSGCAAAS